MPTTLADLSPGFADPVHDAQRCFRCLLDAMARPGRLQGLPASATAALQGPPARAGRPPMGAGLAALMLTLLDADTALHLAGALDTPDAQAWLRFHTGARLVAPAWRASFVALRAADADAALWTQLELGTDEAPQRGATLLLEVPALASADTPRPISPDPAAATCRLTLRGPGVDGMQRLVVGGLSRRFWQQRIALEAERPRGVDLVLVQGTTLAALPRSTRVALDD